MQELAFPALGITDFPVLSVQQHGLSLGQGERLSGIASGYEVHPGGVHPVGQHVEDKGHVAPVGGPHHLAAEGIALPLEGIGPGLAAALACPGAVDPRQSILTTLKKSS